MSGAAASPNMGYHTSPVVAFLMTLFNVRLGWWFPNPAQGHVTRRRRTSVCGICLRSCSAAPPTSRRFVMISDGGHFENLAAYELVRRRCRVIIISDGECDPKLTFEGLGTLIRMCEVDFGAKITSTSSASGPIRTSPWSSSAGPSGASTTATARRRPDLPQGVDDRPGRTRRCCSTKRATGVPARVHRRPVLRRGSVRELSTAWGSEVAQEAFEAATRGPDVSTGESRS